MARAARELGLPLRFVTVKREFLRLPKRDGGGFPCGICRRTLLERAGRLLRRRRFDLLVTGEVVGQAGLSAEDLQRLDEAVGLEGRVLRPLSAKLLPPTWAEAEGFLEREALWDLHADGSLKVRLVHLAPRLGLSPKLGGRLCLLSDPVFAQRCRELGADGNVVFTANFVQLLEFPHLFRLPHGAVLAVATGPAEQVRLQELFLPEDVRLYIPLPGSPLGLLRGPWAKLSPGVRDWIVELAAQKLLALGGFEAGRPWTVCFRTEEAEETRRLRVSPQALREGLSPVN